MQLDETAELLAVAAATDGRRVTEVTVGAWHEVLRYLDYDLAREALARVKADVTINWVEPKHVMEASRAIRRDRERDARRLAQRPDDTPGAPRPDNLDAMTRAYNDPVAFAREVAIYEQQLRDAGYSDQYTESGRVNALLPAYDRR